jgi:hypothetical protein
LIDHTPHAAKQKHCWPRNSASAEKPSTPTSGPVPPHSSPQYASPGNDLPCGNAPSHRPGLESLAEVCGSGQLREFGAWKQYLPGDPHSRRPMAYADSCARQELITPESLDSGSFSPAIHRQQGIAGLNENPNLERRDRRRELAPPTHSRWSCCLISCLTARVSDPHRRYGVRRYPYDLDTRLRTGEHHRARTSTRNSLRSAPPALERTGYSPTSSPDRPKQPGPG